MTDSFPDEASAPDTPAPAPAAPPAGPWALAAREFFRRPNAVAGLALAAVFWLLALLAPFLAHRLPILWIEDGQWSFPLPREFLAPYDLRHEGGLEQALAFCLVFLPAAAVAWIVSGRLWPSLRRSRRSVALILGALLSLAVGGSLWGIVSRVAGDDPFYDEGYAPVDQDEVTRPSALADWIARGAGGRAAVPAAFTPDQLADFARWSSECPDAADPYDADAGQRRRARALAAGLSKIVQGGDFADGDGESRRGAREMRLRALLERRPPPPPAEARALLDRINRINLERLAPLGSIRSFRSFRWGFVLAASAALLSALGAAAILMIAANELRADRRWLVLCALAVLLLPLFLFDRSPSGQWVWRQPRNQPRDFRASAAAGKGWGLFPLLPYGPNEQGFGQKLPPDWAVPSPYPSLGDVLDWDAVVRLLSEGPEGDDSGVPGGRARRYLFGPEKAPLRGLERLALAYWQGRAPRAVVEAGNLGPDSRHGLIATALGLPEGRRLFVEWLGGLVARPDWYAGEAAAAFEPLRVAEDFNLRPYLVDISRLDQPAWTALPPVMAERRNRLLLEKAFPGVLAAAKVNQWKRPDQKAGRHVFGTDESGRDVLVRMLHGSRVSLSVGFVSVALATLIGMAAGALAAYYGGRVDWVVSRFIELMMCFPAFFLILAMIAVLDKRSILNIMLVIGFTGWTGVARLVRGEILQQRALDYVSAARSLGAGDARIIFRHILPNSMAPVFVSVTFGITGAILTESGLSFLGLGVTPPTPTWGQLLAEAREAPLVNWWLAVFPGMALFLGVFSYNLVGEGVRDALDPRLRGGHR